MPGSQALANIEDENDEGWTWKRKLPRKSECLAEQFYENKNKTLFNFRQILVSCNVEGMSDLYRESAFRLQVIF